MEPSRELHWQSAWAAASLGAARRLPGRDKFYALVAYPGSSGFLHVGHLRGLSLADTLHRYHRMLGHAVFFPTGTHASGLPAVTFAQKVADRDPDLVAQLRLYKVDETLWPRLEDPAEAARFLGERYLDAFRRLGLLIDERAYVTTIDPDYQAFIGWQFRRLAEHGALVQSVHYSAVCPVCGPVSVDPSETDLSKGGDAEWITYRTVPFRLEDGRVLLAATLRPETIYGVTNLWVPPTGSLVVWHHGEELFLVSRRAAEQLVGQHGGRIGHEVPVAEVLGRAATVPIVGRSVPVFASELVDPEVGTGVVMSVPAHAPADWLALSELTPEQRSRVGPPPELLLPVPAEQLTPSERELIAGDGPPSERAVRATGARSLEDSSALDEATARLYRLEFVRGRMRPEFAGGRTVAEARETVAAELGQDHHAIDLQEFSIPVICRNGHRVEIRKVPDQWFLHYGEPSWKEKTRALVGRMRFDPPEYAEELRGILDWFDDRPCTRKGRWLGTPFPLDPSWVIEPIADSTFYPAYFIVRPFVRSGRLAVAGLTDAFFDRVFLGRGPGEPSVDLSLQQEVREEFLYWYPLDANIGGKEHKRVHFPVFLYTHALLLPEGLQPRRVIVHWWLTSSGGEKISKRHVGAKGGAIPPLQEATERWGADALRLFYATSANLSQDIEWDSGLVDNAAAAPGRGEDGPRSFRDRGRSAPRARGMADLGDARGRRDRPARARGGRPPGGRGSRVRHGSLSPATVHPPGRGARHRRRHVHLRLDPAHEPVRPPPRRRAGRGALAVARRGAAVPDPRRVSPFRGRRGRGTIPGAGRGGSPERPPIVDGAGRVPAGGGVLRRLAVESGGGAVDPGRRGPGRPPRAADPRGDGAHPTACPSLRVPNRDRLVRPEGRRRGSGRAGVIAHGGGRA